MFLPNPPSQEFQSLLKGLLNKNPTKRSDPLVFHWSYSFEILIICIYIILAIRYFVLDFCTQQTSAHFSKLFKLFFNLNVHLFCHKSKIFCPSEDDGYNFVFKFSNCSVDSDCGYFRWSHFWFASVELCEQFFFIRISWSELVDHPFWTQVKMEEHDAKYEEDEDVNGYEKQFCDEVDSIIMGCVDIFHPL